MVCFSPVVRSRWMRTGHVFLCVLTGREREGNEAINLTEQAWSIEDLWYGKTMFFFLIFFFGGSNKGNDTRGVRQGSLQLALTSKEQNTNPPGSRVFLSLAQFWCTWERLCMNRVRSLLSMRSMLLGYSFEPRPNSRALATGGWVMIIGLSRNGSLHSKKPVWLERTSSNRGQLLWPAACMLINKVSDDVCQWNGHDVVISIGGIFFYRTLCMLHDEEKLSIQWPCSSDFRRFARDFCS